MAIGPTNPMREKQLSMAQTVYVEYGLLQVLRREMKGCEQNFVSWGILGVKGQWYMDRFTHGVALNP